MHTYLLLLRSIVMISLLDNDSKIKPFVVVCQCSAKDSNKLWAVSIFIHSIDNACRSLTLAALNWQFFRKRQHSHLIALEVIWWQIRFTF